MATSQLRRDLRDRLSKDLPIASSSSKMEEEKLCIDSGVAPVRKRSSCCREMLLLEFPDKFVIRSTDLESPDLAFSVGRSDGFLHPLSIGILAEFQQFDDFVFHFFFPIVSIWWRLFLAEDSSCANPSKVMTIYGVVGTIRLLAGMSSYLMICCVFFVRVFNQSVKLW